jgi:exopolysaccharide biosynthesis polyprenyl glycosylphosphotransferase
VIVGTNQEAIAVANQLRASDSSGLAILGFVSVESAETQETPLYLNGLPILGSLETLTKTIQVSKIEEVIVASTSLTRAQLLQTAEQVAQMPSIQMRLSSGLYELFTTGMSITTKNSVPLMTLNRVRLDSIELVLKRVMDITLILGSAPFLVPIFAAIALLIRWDSPGPVFHRRRVLGVGGQTFDALKFRSMVTNGDEVLALYPELVAELKENHKLKNDPRITRVGQFLRRTSLDELPQLLNVLFGQMSLVGPRMITPEEAEKYGDMQYNLLTVKPGLTGLWQVSGRSDLSYEERVRLDMHYIRNYSIWQDIQILFLQTIPTVLAKRGAY